MKWKPLLLVALLLNACRSEKDGATPETGKFLPVYRVFLSVATDTTLPDSSRQLSRILDRVGMTEPELDSLLRRSAGKPKELLNAVSEIIDELEQREKKELPPVKKP